MLRLKVGRAKLVPRPEAKAAVSTDDRLFSENEQFERSLDARQYASVGALQCLRGGFLPEVTVAFETWGHLSMARDNVILVCHALSGDSNAAQWWSRIIGPGLAIDTDRYFVICTNAIGGCRGSTGPSSLSPEGTPYGSRFPVVTVEDMVEVQRRLINQLGITELAMVAGGSMGGMQALAWTLPAPEGSPKTSVRKAWLTASAHAHSAMQIAFNEVARQAIMSDPNWLGGDYYDKAPPDAGLKVARMLGHLTYLSDTAFEQKFGRSLQGTQHALDREMFAVESYLAHQGEKFTSRFDANSLISLTQAIDLFCPPSLEGSNSEYLFTSFTSDWIYPSYQSQRLHEMAEKANCQSQWVEIDLPYGHDAFLLDDQHQASLVRQFLSR